jgi:hypothetical protein
LACDAVVRCAWGPGLRGPSEPPRRLGPARHAPQPPPPTANSSHTARHAPTHRPSHFARPDRPSPSPRSPARECGVLQAPVGEQVPLLPRLPPSPESPFPAARGHAPGAPHAPASGWAPSPPPPHRDSRRCSETRGVWQRGRAGSAGPVTLPKRRCQEGPGRFAHDPVTVPARTA